MKPLAMLISRIYEPIIFLWSHNGESIWIKIFLILLHFAKKTLLGIFLLTLYCVNN